jgi:subtilisin family serine protease
MKPVLAGSLLALGVSVLGAPCSHAAIGDIVAVLRASSVRPAAPSARGTMTTDEARRLAPEASLAITLSTLGYERVTALGAETGAPGTQAIRLVRLSPTRAGLDANAASLAAQKLVDDGAAIAATADRNMKLFVTLPNDSDRVNQNQWYIDGPGNVHLPEAWDLEHGSPSVVIGILDTGVDMGHPDLASKIWTNPGEIPGNGIDDDGNGYIDDVHGWDFGDDDADANPGPLFDDIGLDEGFHGTMVAGIAAAATNNLEGIAGAGWNSMILPLKIADTAGQTLISYAAEAILYCAGKHPGVLNMSVGTATATPSEKALFQSVIDQAVAGNVLCVASAGNEDSSVPVVPGSCNGVLCVGATDYTDSRSSFSNSGPWVDVGAPGELMWGPICRNYPIDDGSQVFYEFFFGWDTFRPYMYADGTSFSSPLTAGVCALVRAHFPTAPALGVLQHIIDTGDAISYDKPIGVKVNAYQALLTPLGVGDFADLVPKTEFVLAPARPTPFSSQTVLSFRLGTGAHVRLAIVDAAGRLVRSLVDEDRPAGAHTAVWDGRADDGRAAPTGLYFAVLDGPAARSVTRLVRIAR